MQVIMEGWRKFLKEEADPNKVDSNLYPLKLRSVNKDTAKDLATGGTQDQNQEDDKVGANTDSMPATRALPAQTSMDLDKFIGMGVQMMLKVGGFTNGAGGDLSAIISSDNHIMDGHHRWAGTILADPKASISGLKVNLPARKLIGVLNVYTISIGKTGKNSTHEMKSLTGDVIKQAFLQKLQTFTQSGIPKIGDAAAVDANTIQQALQKTGMSAEQLTQKAVTNWESVKPYSLVDESWMPHKLDMPNLDPPDLIAVSKALNAGQMDINPPYSQKNQQIVGGGQQPQAGQVQQPNNQAKQQQAVKEKKLRENVMNIIRNAKNRR